MFGTKTHATKKLSEIWYEVTELFMQHTAKFSYMDLPYDIWNHESLKDTGSSFSTKINMYSDQ